MLDLSNSQRFLDKSCVIFELTIDLDSEFIGPLMKVLCLDESKPVTKERYDQFIASFMI